MELKIFWQIPRENTTTNGHLSKIQRITGVVEYRNFEILKNADFSPLIFALKVSISAKLNKNFSKCLRFSEVVAQKIS